MKREQNPSFLRLVETTDQIAQVSPIDLHWDRLWQPTLFPEFSNDLIVTLDLDIKPTNLVVAFEQIKPIFVVDIRIVPRFDYESMSRRFAFDLFRKCGAIYFDVAGDLGVLDSKDARLNPALVGDYVRRKVVRSGRLKGPIAFLTNEHKVASDYMPLLISHVAGAEKWQWVRM